MHMNLTRRLNDSTSPEALLERLGLYMSATAPKNKGGGKPPAKKPKPGEESPDEDEGEAADEDEDEDEEEDDDDTSELERERAKKKKLLKEKKALLAKQREREEADAEAEAEREKKAGDLQKTVDRQAKQITDLTAERDGFKSKLESKVVDDGISNALDAVNVNPKLKKGAISVIRSDHEVEMDDDGDATIDGDPIDKFIKKWSRSETGKAYIKMKSNGGGSNGSGDDGGDDGDDDSGSSGKVKNPWKKETFNMTQQGVLLRTNAKLAEKFKREAGVLK